MSKNRQPSEKRSLLRFLLVVAACGAGGFGIGFFGAMLDPETIWSLGARLSPMLAAALPVLVAAANAVLLVLSLIRLRQARKLAARAEEDEELYLAAEDRLNLPLLGCSILLIVNMLQFSASLALVETESVNGDLMMTVSGGLMLLGTVWIVAVESACVRLVKQWNPEKRGSVFDFDFQRQWENSCDEGQLLIIYRAGYRAYSVTSRVCLVLWLLTLILQLIFDTGFLPALLVGAVYLTMLITYFAEARRLEKHR